MGLVELEAEIRRHRAQKVNKQLYPTYSMDITYPPYYDDVNKVMTDALKVIYNDQQASVKSAMDDAARKIDAILEDYKRRTG